MEPTSEHFYQRRIAEDPVNILLASRTFERVWYACHCPPGALANTTCECVGGIVMLPFRLKRSDRGPSPGARKRRWPGAIRHGQTGAAASDHYHRHDEGVALMKEIGLRGYRFSISWRRWQPGSRYSRSPVTGTPAASGSHCCSFCRMTGLGLMSIFISTAGEPAPVGVHRPRPAQKNGSRAAPGLDTAGAGQAILTTRKGPGGS